VTVGSVIHVGVGQGARQRRLPLKKVLATAGIVLIGLISALGAWIGVTILKIDHAVHHVGISPGLLAQGHNDLLAVVRGPHHSEEIYVFRTSATHTNVLVLPTKLGVAGPSGRSVPLSSISLHSPSSMIAGLKHIGIPVGHYVGIDLHSVNPASSLGELATGKVSMTSLISHPAGTASLLEAVASHVYLGPHTSVSALLSLMHVPVGAPVSVPTSTEGNGTVVLAAPATAVLRHFL
jgi:hypothetical protein